LVYAWAGHTSIFSNGKIFNFIEATRRIIELVGPSASSLSNFANLFSEVLYGLLQSVLGTTLESSPSQELLAEVLFVGYFRGQSFRVEIDVRQRNLVILEPLIFTIQTPAPIEFATFSGSPKMSKLFEPNLIEPKTAQEGATLIRDYIQLCIDRQSQEPECADIGGHIHLGLLTKDAFVWIEPPRSI
jgi:hypothetical protein